MKLGKKRGIDKEASMLFSLAENSEVETLVLELDVIGREMKDLKDMAMFIYDGDRQKIMNSNEWSEILSLQKTRSKIRTILNETRKKKRKKELISIDD